jgi:hypothetical protein
MEGEICLLWADLVRKVIQAHQENWRRSALDVRANVVPTWPRELDVRQAMGDSDGLEIDPRLIVYRTRRYQRALTYKRDA